MTAGVKENSASPGAAPGLASQPQPQYRDQQDKEERVINAVDLSLRAARTAQARKADDLVVLDVRDLVSYTSFFVICHGTNTRQVAAIAEGIRSELKEESGIAPLGIEGLQRCRWVLVDYGDVIIHVFDEAQRGFYDLESLWMDAPRVPLPEAEPPSKPAEASSASTARA